MRQLSQVLTKAPIPYSESARQTSVAVILHQNQILLIKRKINPKDLHSGQIAFPGGKVEAGEDSLKAAMRETQEEIGVTLKEE